MAQVHFFALSDRWSSAVNNDAFCAEKIGRYHLFAVAEGMSDFPGASSASGIAISTLQEIVRAGRGSPAALLGNAVRESEARIIAQIGKRPEMSRDATHLSAGIVDDRLDCTILDTGEGNAYLIDPEHVLVPKDDPGAGIPAPGPRAGDDRNRADMIAHTLGEPRMIRGTDITEINIRDRFLLFSSGGLHDFVPREKMAEIVIRNGENVETSCEQLRQEALVAGGERTITIVLVHGHLH